MKRIGVLLVISFFLFFNLVANGLASVGIAIAPSSGSYKFTLDGGVIDFTVYNSGSEDGIYTIDVSGSAEEFTSTEPLQIPIKSNSYAVFKAIIDPAKEVKPGQAYTLTVTAKMVSTGNIAIEAKSNVNLLFEGERTKPYVEKTTSTTIQTVSPQSKPSRISPLAQVGKVTAIEEEKFTQYEMVVIVIILSVGVLYGVYRKIR